MKTREQLHQQINGFSTDDNKVMAEMLLDIRNILLVQQGLNPSSLSLSVDLHNKLNL